MRNPESRETIIYGGAFNPPTLAHSRILEATAEYAKNNNADIWIVPSGNRSDKAIPVDRKTRLGYLAAMIADSNIQGVPVEVITDELDRTIEVETYDTVMEFQGSYPDRELVWVFGADSTETMGDWKNGDWLLENLRMLVVDREGSKINPLAKRAIALNVAPLDISSTIVREHLARGKSVREFVTPSVEELLAS